MINDGFHSLIFIHVICSATHNNLSVKYFFVELPLLSADFMPGKVNFPLTHTAAQLGKMCQGLSYMTSNEYSSLANACMIVMQYIEREVSHIIIPLVCRKDQIQACVSLLVQGEPRTGSVRRPVSGLSDTLKV